MRRTPAYRIRTAAFACALAAPATARAQAVPAQVAVTVQPGDSTLVATVVELPEAPARLDFLLVVDLTASFADDLVNLKTADLFDDIRALVPDSRFAVASFVDFPFGPWGQTGSAEYAYRLDLDFTTNRATWLNALGGLSTRDGGDLPESQYEALFQAVTGLGREITPFFEDGDFDDPGEIAPDQNASFRAGATKVIGLLTDTSFHNAGETCAVCPFPYPGASRDEVVTVLKDNGIKVIAIKAPGAGAQMDDLAAATDGAVVTTDASSATLAEAAVDGLQSVTFTVVPAPRTSCNALELSYSPVLFDDAPAGGAVLFEERIAVPSNFDRSRLDASGALTCEVDFLADETIAGTQVIRVVVPKVDQCGCNCQRWKEWKRRWKQRWERQWRAWLRSWWKKHHQRYERDRHRPKYNRDRHRSKHDRRSRR
jgi:hypothetical protein